MNKSLQFNISKCKYMVMSRRREPLSPISPLLLNGLAIEEVHTFKYLGLLLSSDMSWSPHIENICSKAKKILGLLYRQYYSHVDIWVIRQMYISLVRPHLEYACTVWDPHKQKDVLSLERVQPFAYKVGSKHWNDIFVNC